MTVRVGDRCSHVGSLPPGERAYRGGEGATLPGEGTDGAGRGSETRRRKRIGEQNHAAISIVAMMISVNPLECAMSILS
jgi:hypothetical protein